jgi:hypothetical protein
MSKYITHPVHLSIEQCKKLMKGDGIRLKHEHYHGKHHIHITSRQAAKLIKHDKMGKGMILKFDGKQIAHHVKHGDGFWSTLWNKIKSRAIPLIKEHGPKLAKSIAEKGIKHLLGKGMIPEGNSMYAGEGEESISQSGTGMHVPKKKSKKAKGGNLGGNLGKIPVHRHHRHHKLGGNLK